MQYKELYVNAMSDATMNKITCVQGDTARALRIHTDIDLSQVVSARIYMKKPDGLEIYNSCTVAANYIEVPLTSQALSTIGNVVAQLNCIDNDGMITTYKFIIEVFKNYTSDSAILSTNEYNALYTILAAANASVVNTMAEMTDHGKTYYLTTTGYAYRWDSTTSSWVTINTSDTNITSSQVQIDETN